MNWKRGVFFSSIMQRPESATTMVGCGGEFRGRLELWDLGLTLIFWAKYFLLDSPPSSVWGVAGSIFQTIVFLTPVVKFSRKCNAFKNLGSRWVKVDFAVECHCSLICYSEVASWGDIMLLDQKSPMIGVALLMIHSTVASNDVFH